jgi:DnaJ-class molecular chaperone
MKDQLLDLSKQQVARGDVPRERACLRCKTMFSSEGFGERICKRCKGSSTWRNPASASGGGGGTGSKARSSGSSS